MSEVRFEARLVKIGSLTLLRLPKGASAKLPSRHGDGQGNHQRFPLSGAART